MIKRRDFITLLGSAAAWPVAARAQQGNRVRRIGVLMAYDESDPEGKAFVSAFTQALANLGWADGRNARMDIRWGRADINRIRALAQELVGLQPDIILTNGTRDRRPAGDTDHPGRLCGRDRPRRQRHRPATQPARRERHRLRRLGSHAGRQVA